MLELQKQGIPKSSWPICSSLQALRLESNPGGLQVPLLFVSVISVFLSPESASLCMWYQEIFEIFPKIEAAKNWLELPAALLGLLKMTSCWSSILSFSKPLALFWRLLPVCSLPLWVAILLGASLVLDTSISSGDFIWFDPPLFSRSAEFVEFDPPLFSKWAENKGGGGETQHRSQPTILRFRREWSKTRGSNSTNSADDR